MYLATLLSSCFSARADLAYHQNQIGESTIGHFMIFSISPRLGEALLFMKLEFKWLKFITNKFVIYYQAMVLKRDILFLCLLYIARPTTIMEVLCTGLSFLLLFTLLFILIIKLAFLFMYCHINIIHLFTSCMYVFYHLQLWLYLGITMFIIHLQNQVLFP